MLDIYALAAEYISACQETSVLKKRIIRMNQINETANAEAVLPVGLATAERAVNEIVSRWKRSLLKLELVICRYELAASMLTNRERVVLKLHYEQGITLRNIAKMDLSAYGIDSVSVSTLSRTCKLISEKFTLQMQVLNKDNEAEVIWLKENE